MAKTEYIIYSRNVYGRYQDGTKAVIKNLPEQLLTAQHIEISNVMQTGHNMTIQQQQPGVWAFTNEATIKAFQGKNLFILPQETELQILAVGTDNAAAHLENMKQHRPATPAAKKPAAKKSVKKKPAAKAKPKAKATPAKKATAKKK